MAALTKEFDDKIRGPSRTRSQAVKGLARRTPATLRRPLRASETNDRLHTAIAEAIGRKPRGHDFMTDRRRPALARHMSVTGG